jgi:Icc-related predicted phosphoesterase
MQDRLTLTIAALGDLHVSRHSDARYGELFAEASRRANAILLAGDLTDSGHPEEAHLLADDVSASEVPVIGVLGNHDYDAGREIEVAEILRRAGVAMLDGDVFTIEGVGFAGVKGFGGGFGRRMLTAFGETAIREYVAEAEAEARKLERALSQLRGRATVVLTHYSPARDTVIGEAEEIFPFLGSSRLEQVIDEVGANLAIHGHAHHGSPEGTTAGGTPVYNVAIPLLRRSGYEAGYRLIEVPMAEEESVAVAEGDSSRR